MNIAQLLGRNVLDLSSATTIGRIDDVVIDAETRRVVAFRVGKGPDSHTWLPFGDVTAVGADAVTVADPARIVAAPPDAPAGIAGLKALGGRVLTDQGREIGPLEALDIDEAGSVSGLTVAAGALAADDLLGLGSYATVVADRQHDG